MTDYNQEYFYIRRKGTNNPMIEFFNWQDGFSKSSRQENTPIPFKFCEPIPDNPQFADLHSGGSTMVISEKIKEQLDAMKLKDVQLIPATIEDINGDEHDGYYYIHIYNLIECMDKEKSEWRSPRRHPDKVMSVDKLVLDNEKLDKIPLEERLVFALSEEPLTKLYHRSVVEKILSAKPTGVRFYCISDFDGSQPFEDEFWDYIMS